MFLKNLLIENNSGVIRNISFRRGINLIVDETLNDAPRQKTGNNVGKSTVLRLIDYCLGSEGKSIYQDVEFSSQPGTVVKNFLQETGVNVTIELVDDLDDTSSRMIKIKRNFLNGKKKIIEISGEPVRVNEFEPKLKQIIFDSSLERPTFRQIISKNIRIEQTRMQNILKVLSNFDKNEDYEALFLFWLGIQNDSHKDKTNLIEERKREEAFRRRLMKEGELPLVSQKLTFHEEKIREIEAERESFWLNENFAQDVDKLNQLRFELNKISTEIGYLLTRKELIVESIENLRNEFFTKSTDQIKSLYSRAKALIPELQVTFEQTVRFHNELVVKKLDYINKELPELEGKLTALNYRFSEILVAEKELSGRIKYSDTNFEHEKMIVELNKLYERKGVLEQQKQLWIESDKKLARIIGELGLINSDFANLETLIESRITLFNKYFRRMANRLYGEEYLLSHTKVNSFYGLNVTNVESNPSTGKKKGQIAAFDFAYLQFAEDLELRYLHFILHDQLESIHDNQLNTLIEVANSLNGQYIVPILRDKIPPGVAVEDYTVLSLSQEDKLFRF